MTVEWLVPVAQARSIALALHGLASTTRLSPGCLGCSLSTDFESQGRVSYIEDWGTADDFHHHLDTPAFAHLATLIEDVSRKPRIEFPAADLRQRADLLQAVDAAVKAYRRAEAEAEEPMRKPRRAATGSRLFTRR
jgi:quinol monooxygenase YgiN